MKKWMAAAAAGLLAVVGLATPASAAEPTAGAVHGTLTRADGTPLAGAYISVENPDDPRTLRLGRSDAAGHYRIADVAPGSVTVSYYTTSAAEQYVPGTLDPAHATRFPVVIGLTTLVDDQQLATGTVQGRFTTAAGAPISGARVTIETLEDQFLGLDTTGADGRYEVTGVPVGPVRVQIYSQGIYQYAHGVRRPEAATTFTVQADQALTVDETQVPTGTITGRFLGSSFLAYAHSVDGLSIIQGATKADGTYSITVPVDRWRVVIHPSGYSTGQWVPGTADKADAQVIDVAAGQTVALPDQTPLPTGSISGTARRADGRPIYDQSVTLWRNGERITSVYTGEDGEFTFPQVITGEYLLSNSQVGYFPGTLRAARATPVVVRAGQDTVANGRAPQRGKISGRLTLPGGAPASDFFVRAVPVDPESVAEGVAAGGGLDITAADGTWELPDVYPDDFTIEFKSPDQRFTQYAYGKTAGDADVFTVTSGGSVTVDDVWRLGASVTVRAIDATTGDPITGFCAQVPANEGNFCTEGTEVVAPGLPAGPTQVIVRAGGDYLASAPTPVTATDDGQASVTVPLAVGGRVNTTIVDKVTGAPVHQACVTLVTPGTGGVSAQSRDCTNRRGKLTTAALPAGTYQLFVTGPYGYGAQWVTAAGGTGDQREADKIKVKAGKTTKAGTVLLDKAGTVSGVVRDPAGQPVPGVQVDKTAWELWSGDNAADASTDAQGRYTLGGLGPYEWPLLFTPATTLPRQWSGGVANRFRAATVAVQTGATSTYDTTLVAGATLTGTVTVAAGGAGYTGGRLTAVNAATGDHLATASIPAQGGSYAMTVVGGNPVRIEWFLGSPAKQDSGVWQDGAEVKIPKTGTTTVDLAIG